MRIIALEQDVYENKVLEVINKSITNELSSAISYTRLLNDAKGMASSELYSELNTHADEEFGHFKELVTFAGRFGLEKKLKFEIDPEFIAFTSESLEEIAKFNLEKETEAFTLYKEGLRLADEQDDDETKMFFQKLMETEMEHFDDMAIFVSEKRVIGQ